MVTVVGATVALAVGSSALALSGLRTGPVGTSAAVSPSGPAGTRTDEGLFVDPGPFGSEPSVVRALPQAPQPLAPPSGSGPSSSTPVGSWSGAGGGVPTSGPLSASPASAGGSAGRGMLGFPSLPQLISGPAPVYAAAGPSGPGRDPGERGSSGNGGGLLGLPSDLLDRPDDEQRGSGKDRDDDGGLRGEQGEFDRPDRSGQPERPNQDDPDRGAQAPPSVPALPAAPPGRAGEAPSVEQMAQQAQEQAMAIARERIAQELRARRESELNQAEQRQADQQQTEQRRAEQQRQAEQQRRAQEQGRCDVNDPQPSISLERDESGKITTAQASDFGEGCVGKEVRLEIRTEDGTVTSTSPVSDDRSATFSLSSPVAQDKIRDASLSSG